MMSTKVIKRIRVRCCGGCRALLTAVILLVAGLALFTGCEYYPEDPRAYPVQPKPTYNISSITSHITLLNLAGDYGVVVMEFQRPYGLEHFYARVVDPLDGRFINQTPVHLRRMIPDGENAEFFVCGHVDGDLDGDDECYFTLKNDTLMYLYEIDARTGALSVLDSLLQPPETRDYIFDFRFHVYTYARYPETTDPSPVFGVANVSGYVPLPRQERVLKRLNPPAEIMKFDFSSPLGLFRAAMDINGDGRDEYLYSTLNPCNGRQIDGFTDTVSYFLAVDHTGKIVWSTTLEAHGGGSQLGVHPFHGDTLIGLDNWHTLHDSLLITDLYHLEAASGTVLQKRMLPGDVRGCFDPATARVGHLIGTEMETNGTLVSLYSIQGERLRSKLFPFLMSYDFRLKHPAYEDSLYRFNATQHGTFLLDANLNVVARFPGSFGRQRVHRDTGENRVVAVMYDDDEKAFVGELVKRPWYQWWVWRWRWALLAGLVLPVAAFGIVMLVRYIRARRQYMRELKHAYDQLTESHHELEKLNRQLNDLLSKTHTAQEEERQRIAKDLHDEMGGLLSTIKRYLENTQRGYAVGDPETEGKLTYLQELIDQGAELTHRISYNLQPPVLEKFGLVAAVNHYLESFERDTGLRVEHAVDLSLPRLQTNVEIAIFRILQEALSNVKKYAQSDEVRVSLWEDDDVLQLIVEDEGVGFDTSLAAESGSLGLFGMQQRVRPFNGIVTISSQPGKGSTIQVDVPGMAQWGRDT